MPNISSSTNIIPDGILPVDKITGVTSFDIIRRVKAAFKKSGRSDELKKIGHAGTLDPIASGLVIALINGGTKKSDSFLNLDKTYEAELFIGYSTDSYDASGETADKIPLDANYYEIPDNFKKLLDALDSFKGEIMQEPPMFSAIKKNGRPLYKLARQKITIEREKRKCVIYSIGACSDKPLYDENLQGFKFKYTVKCSKGTYIRSLCHDMGAAIGVPCHMSALRRTGIGGYKVEDALAYEQIERGDMQSIVKSIYQIGS
jgi:tRNA pseudouridine55 synthase